MGCNNSVEQVVPQTYSHPLPQQQPHSNESKGNSPTSSATLPSDADKPSLENKEKQEVAKSLKEEAEAPQLSKLDIALEIHVNQIFETYDKSMDGFINIVEFTKLLKQNVDANLTSQEIKEYFKVADIKGRKKISKQEMLVLYKTLVKY